MELLFNGKKYEPLRINTANGFLERNISYVSHFYSNFIQKKRKKRKTLDANALLA